jgi:hypothetical protein
LKEIIVLFLRKGKKSSYFPGKESILEVEEGEKILKQPALRFSCTLIGRGWVEATLANGINQQRFLASYLSDAIGDLLRVVISLLEGARRGTCLWEQEPGEYRWLFTRQDEQIQIRIVSFGQTFSRQFDEEGECVLTVQCSLLKFPTKLSKQLEQLLATWDENGYHSTWGYPFPQEDFQKMKRLLSRARRITKDNRTLPE